MRDKVILITGTTSGIGRALASGFLADGGRVVALNRRPHPSPPDVSADKYMDLQGDVTSPEDVERAVQAAELRLGRIDILINNAGTANRGSFLEQPFARWKEVIDTNLTGVALCTHVVLRGMLERRHGRVINMGSRAAEVAKPGTSAYSSSKAGVIAFTRAIAAEIGVSCDDVLVNVVIPGPTRTNMSPSAGQAPEAVYAHVRYVADLPRGGATGKVFWNSKEYKMYSLQHEE